MPRSADASERWVKSVCSTPVKKVVTPKPIPKPAATPKSKPKTKTITETITIQIPGSRSQTSDAAQFFPSPLTASVYPAKVLSIGQVATFSSDPIAHFGSAKVLGRQAEVHFVPQSSGWIFSDGDTRIGSDTSKSFAQAGKFHVEAYVDYTVSYRLLGETNWQRVAGVLTIASNTLEVLVGARNLEGDRETRAGLLVGQDCIQNPGSFGCDL